MFALSLVFCFIGGFSLGHGIVRIPFKAMFGLDVDPLDLGISFFAILVGAVLLYFGFTL
jgi:hypothetical protein